MKHYEDLIRRLRTATKLPLLQALMNEAADAIQSLTAADVRPVVLCRDCKWTKKDDMDDPAIYCRKWDRWGMPPDGFCWLGRKKEES